VEEFSLAFQLFKDVPSNREIHSLSVLLFFWEEQEVTQKSKEQRKKSLFIRNRFVP
jgi:hypothetical protein